MKIHEGAVRAFNFLARRAGAYKDVFVGPVGQIVLQDLAKFCRANETCFDLDPRIHAALEGRREVWLRIQNHLQLSPEELWKIHNPATSLTGE
jgi:hypothetical protein